MIVITVKLSGFHLSQKQVKWAESQFQFFKNMQAASYPEPAGPVSWLPVFLSPG